jgi:hypothetical protein
MKLPTSSNSIPGPMRMSLIFWAWLNLYIFYQIYLEYLLQFLTPILAWNAKGKTTLHRLHLCCDTSPRRSCIVPGLGHTRKGGPFQKCHPWKCICNLIRNILVQCLHHFTRILWYHTGIGKSSPAEPLIHHQKALQLGFETQCVSWKCPRSLQLRRVPLPVLVHQGLCPCRNWLQEYIIWLTSTSNAHIWFATPCACILTQIIARALLPHSTIISWHGQSFASDHLPFLPRTMGHRPKI